jgi:hypothetical protein
VVKKNMNDCALTISLTWHQIEGLLQKHGVIVTDETLNWAKETLMEHGLFLDDLTHSGHKFFRLCVHHLAMHPEHEA